MKNIRLYEAPKYATNGYEQAGEGIWKNAGGEYVVSLVFEQEPELGENDPSSEYVSQYPLEDILDEYMCYCSDFYETENREDPVNSYVEFASPDLKDVLKVAGLIGKHVYNKEDGNVIRLIVE